MIIKFLDSHTMSLEDDMDFSPLKKMGEYHDYTITNDDDVINYCKDAEIIITNKIEFNDDIMKNLPGLKLICVIATGYNVIDTEAASKRNIVVSNVPDYAGHSVSQHTFALILNLYSHVCKYNADISKGDWEKSPSFTLLRYPVIELAGKTMGIIGFGAIGRESAKIAAGFSMKVLVNDKADMSVYGYANCNMDELLKRSDIISLHTPLTPDTRNLITREELKKMKNTAIIINTARGGIINEEDLAWALNTGEIGGAGIDVLTEEPPRKGNPLLKGVKNLILTPHVAWSSRGARQRLIDITAKNIKAFKEGKPINVVGR